MSTLAPVVESLEKVPEAAREFYTARDEAEGGGFVLDTRVEEHPGALNLKKALGAERTRADEMTAAQRTLQKEVADLRKQVDTKDRKGADTSDLEKVLAKREAELRAEFEPVMKENTDLKAKDLKRDLSDVVDAAALKGGVLPDRLEDARGAYARHFRLNEEKKVVVLDDDGYPLSVTPEKFFAERFRDKKPWFYAGSGATGGGASGSTGALGSGGVITLTREQAGDYATYSATLRKVGGDHSKIKVGAA